MFENKNIGLGSQLSRPTCETSSVPRVSETENVIIKLQNSVSVLGDMIASIETKLEPITKHSNVKDDEVCEPEFGTKIAQEINKAVRNIQYLAEKVRDLRERIEL